jgi:MFS family permease
VTANTDAKSVVRDRGILALLFSESISTTGTRMTWLALPWFVLTTTGSAKQMSFVIGSEVAASAIFGLPSGLVIARLGARRSMLICDLVRVPLLMLPPVLYWLHVLHLSELVAVGFAVGAFTTPYGPAQRMLMAELLDDEPARVGQANALFQGAQRTTLVVGPTLAGILIGFIGAPRVLVVDAATYLIAFVLVGLLVPRPLAVKRHEGSAPRLLDGLRYLRTDKLLARLIASLIVLDGAFAAIIIAIPVLVFVDYAANARLAGVFLGSWGAGALVGNVTAYRKLSHGATHRTMALLFMIQAAPLFILALAVPAFVIVLAMVVSGVANGLSNPTFHSMMTLRPPVAVRANVLTAFFTASAIGAPIAVMAAGAAFGPFGPRTVLAVGAGVELAVGLFVARAFLRSSSVADQERSL